MDPSMGVPGQGQGGPLTCPPPGRGASGLLLWPSRPGAARPPSASAVGVGVAWWSPLLCGAFARHRRKGGQGRCLGAVERGQRG